MERYFVLQDVETLKYYGSYRIDEYWTKEICDAKKFADSNNINLDETALDFLSEATVKVVEIIDFKQ